MATLRIAVVIRAADRYPGSRKNEDEDAVTINVVGPKELVALETEVLALRPPRAERCGRCDTDLDEIAVGDRCRGCRVTEHRGGGHQGGNPKPTHGARLAIDPSTARKGRPRVRPAYDEDGASGVSWGKVSERATVVLKQLVAEGYCEAAPEASFNSLEHVDIRLRDCIDCGGGFATRPPGHRGRPFKRCGACRQRRAMPKTKTPEPEPGPRPEMPNAKEDDSMPIAYEATTCNVCDADMPEGSRRAKDGRCWGCVQRGAAPKDPTGVHAKRSKRGARSKNGAQSKARAKAKAKAKARPKRGTRTNPGRPTKEAPGSRLAQCAAPPPATPDLGLELDAEPLELPETNAPPSAIRVGNIRSLVAIPLPSTIGTTADVLALAAMLAHVGESVGFDEADPEPWMKLAVAVRDAGYRRVPTASSEAEVSP